MGDDSDPAPPKRQDERVSIPLPFEDAMRALLETKPDESNGKRAAKKSDPVEDQG